MSLISKKHLRLTIQAIKGLLSQQYIDIQNIKEALSQKLGKEDHYTDEEMLELLSETVDLTPATENGKLLVEGDAYLVL